MQQVLFRCFLAVAAGGWPLTCGARNLSPLFADDADKIPVTVSSEKIAGANVAEISRAIAALLRGDPAVRVPRIQRQILTLLGYCAELSDGTRVIGGTPQIAELDPDVLRHELAPDVPIIRAVRVTGTGPEPLRLRIPLDQNLGPDAAVYRRIQKGLYLETPAEWTTRGDTLILRTLPGDFVVTRKSAMPSKALLDQILLHWPDPTDDPAARSAWRLWRAVPDAAAGPVPLLLIHGTGTNRWANFLDWVAGSDEADALRRQFQVWVYDQPMAGINAAIGFDAECPAYANSIVAWLRVFLDQAVHQGVETDGVRYYWPEGPFAILTNSSGGLKALAFMNNYPDWAEQVLACVNLGAPMLGSPLATIEWGRHTVSRLGIGRVNLAAAVLENLVRINYFSVKNQSDLDNGWGNFDETAGQGIPHRRFLAWTIDQKWHPRVLSPRDANTSWARIRPDYPDDTTFEPAGLLDNWCGGLDQVIPTDRGGNFLDRFYCYGGYVRDFSELTDLAARSNDDKTGFWKNFIESVGLRLTSIMMGLYESPRGRWPLTAYQLNDGFVPLQSMMICPGQAGRNFFRTRRIMGWELPVWPLEPDWDFITENTLALPEHLRIFPGWSHLEIVNGRYDHRTRHSELFRYVAADLLDALKP